MDKLKEAALFYKENLLNKKFHLKAGKKGITIEFDIIFSSNEFKHLSGLQKLKDLPEIAAAGSDVIFRQILNDELTYEKISRSSKLSECEARIDYFKDIKEALFGKEVLIKSLHGEFNSIRADFMLTHQDSNYGYAHLFLIEKGDKGVTVPVTFIINANNNYLQNNPNKWTVLSIEEVKTAQATDKKVEIEPQHIYKKTDDAVMIKIPGDKPGEKKAVWLKNKNIVLDKDGTHVIGVREDLQQKHGLKLPVGQPKRYLK